MKHQHYQRDVTQASHDTTLLPTMFMAYTNREVFLHEHCIEESEHLEETQVFAEGTLPGQSLDVDLHLVVPRELSLRVAPAVR